MFIVIFQINCLRPRKSASKSKLRPVGELQNLGVTGTSCGNVRSTTYTGYDTPPPAKVRKKCKSSTLKFEGSVR
jgi:hypothetical protein